MELSKREQFTKEQLIAKAREQIAFCRHTKITGEGRTHVNQCSALFEIALAVLTAPEEVPRQVFDVIYQECGGFVDSAANPRIIWDACRTAILKGGAK